MALRLPGRRAGRRRHGGALSPGLRRRAAPCGGTRPADPRRHGGGSRVPRADRGPGQDRARACGRRRRLRQRRPARPRPLCAHRCRRRHGGRLRLQPARDDGGRAAPADLRGLRGPARRRACPPLRRRPGARARLPRTARRAAAGRDLGDAAAALSAEPALGVRPARVPCGRRRAVADPYAGGLVPDALAAPQPLRPRRPARGGRTGRARARGRRGDARAALLRGGAEPRPARHPRGAAASRTRLRRRCGATSPGPSSAPRRPETPACALCAPAATGPHPRAL